MNPVYSSSLEGFFWFSPATFFRNLISGCWTWRSRGRRGRGPVFFYGGDSMVDVFCTSRALCCPIPKSYSQVCTLFAAFVKFSNRHLAILLVPFLGWLSDPFTANVGYLRSLWITWQIMFIFLPSQFIPSRNKGFIAGLSLMEVNG